ncbi:hypothetical protein TNCV_298901 [Trichonephila clavipes]|nr:hypothetical protein TNCV_298901 [Trichonephila clavipes]
MKSCQDIEIVELLNDEITAQFQEQRDALRQDAKKQIYKVQDENRPHIHNLQRRQAHKYQLHDPGEVAFPVMMADVGLDMSNGQPSPMYRVVQSTLTSHPVRNVRLKDTRENTQTDVRDAKFRRRGESCLV